MGSGGRCSGCGGKWICMLNFKLFGWGADQSTRETKGGREEGKGGSGRCRFEN